MTAYLSVEFQEFTYVGWTCSFFCLPQSHRRKEIYLASQLSAVKDPMKNVQSHASWGRMQAALQISRKLQRRFYKNLKMSIQKSVHLSWLFSWALVVKEGNWKVLNLFVVQSKVGISTIHVFSVCCKTMYRTMLVYWSMLIETSCGSDSVCAFSDSVCDSSEALTLKNALLEIDATVNAKMTGLIKKCGSRDTRLKCMVAK